MCPCAGKELTSWLSVYAALLHVVLMCSFPGRCLGQDAKFDCIGAGSSFCIYSVNVTKLGITIKEKQILKNGTYGCKQVQDSIWF